MNILILTTIIFGKQPCSLSNVYFDCNLQPETVNELPPVVSQFDMIAALSHKTFNERVLQVPEYMGGRKVLAALVMKKGGSECRGTVICLGTGMHFSFCIC